MIYLKADTAVRVLIGPAVAVGDGFTPVTGLSLSTADEAEIIKYNGNSALAVTDISGNTFSAVTSADGYYDLSLTAAQLDTEGFLVVLINDDSLILPIRHEFMVVNANVYDSLFAVSGTDTLDVQVAGMDASTVTASAIATGAIDADAIAADAITAAKVADGTIDAATFAAGAIDAAAIATDAIDADALASDAVTEIRSLVSGTASGNGTTTTLVDSVRTEANNDHWKGQWIVFTSGTAANINQVRLITGFTASTDTITFAPALNSATATSDGYEILPTASVDVRQWLGSTVNALVSGAVDADVSALQANAITAASIAASALDGKGDWLLASSAPTNFGDMSITASTGLVDITQAAADKAWSTASRVLTANTNLNDPSLTQIVDGILDEDMTGHQTQGTLGQAIGDPGATAKSIWQATVSDATGASVGVDVGTILGRVPDTLSLANINAEVVDVIDTDTSGEPGQGAPPATTALRTKIDYLYKNWRNKKDQTSSTWQLYADDASTVDQKATVSDDGTTADKGEIASGP